MAICLLASCEPEVIVENVAANEEEVAEEVTPTSQPNGRTANGGSFTVLSYNVAGLPDILSRSNPAENTSKIVQIIREYDI